MTRRIATAMLRPPFLWHILVEARLEVPPALCGRPPPDWWAHEATGLFPATKNEGPYCGGCLAAIHTQIEEVDALA